MQVKIISDGTLTGTKVVNAQTHEKLEHITSLTWHLDVVSHLATAVVVFQYVPVELSAEIQTSIARFPSIRWLRGLYWLRRFKHNLYQMLGFGEKKYVVHLPENHVLRNSGNRRGNPNAPSSLPARDGRLDNP